MPALSIDALRVHLQFCAGVPRLGRHFGLAFSTSGMPSVVCLPYRR
jgi:hypothetical protein